MESAWDAFGNEIAESIRADFDLYSQSKDDQVLANRGYRTLTAKESAWYTGIAQALKVPSPSSPSLTSSKLRTSMT
mgnify:CR=1 FL=1